jgi:hypothetical protein
MVSIRGLAKYPTRTARRTPPRTNLLAECRNWAARRMPILVVTANPPQTSRGALTGRRRSTSTDTFEPSCCNAVEVLELELVG